MLYITNLQNVSVHRTFSPLYEKYEATPYGTLFLDPAETNNIYTGMVMQKTGPSTVALLNGSSTTAYAFGFSGLDRNSDIDDYTNTLNNSWTVWIGGANAVFQIEAPAFDVSASAGYTVPTNGSRQYLYPYDTGLATASGALGQLTTDTGHTADSAGLLPVAELLDVLGPTTLVIRLLLNFTPSVLA